MKIAIIGTGGVGGYFGGKLAKAGFDVTFLARGEHLKALTEKGLSVKSVQGDFQVNNVKATDKIENISPVDLIILGVKALQVKEVAKDLTSIIHPGTVILPLQNGVLAVDELKEHIDASHILGGLCRIISKIESPGVISHFGVNPTIILGEVDRSGSERTQKVLAVFEKAGIEAKVSENIQVELWKKFIGICVSGLLAVTRCTFGEIREIAETKQLMRELFNEIYQLAHRMRINIEADFVSKTISYIDTFPYEATSSLTRDVWDGKPSEIEYQNGTVVKLGERYDVPTPINRYIYYSILPMELKARKAKS
jgi:2-dehydropantoate 2-reductase